jgi:hypothetical protein
MITDPRCADLPTPTIAEILCSYPFRVGVYAIVVMVVFELVYSGIRAQGAAAMGAENGPIEMAQVALAVIGACGLFAAACLARVGRAGVVLCGAAVAYAAARESDRWFESILFDDAYKLLIGFPMLTLVCLVTFVDRRRLVGDLMWLMHQPAATLFAIAGIFLCFVCQILDRPDMWSSVIDANQMVNAKALIEEYCELFAYLLVAFSGVEAAVLAYQRRRASGLRRDESGETVPALRIAA